jgi:protein tyrosine phosphatase (PTP) superfamily phosphohydrolase (DUF442 family)
VGSVGVFGQVGGRDTAKEAKKKLISLSAVRPDEEEDAQRHQNDIVFSFVFFFFLLNNSE